MLDVVVGVLGTGRAGLRCWASTKLVADVAKSRAKAVQAGAKCNVKEVGREGIRA